MSECQFQHDGNEPTEGWRLFVCQVCGYHHWSRLAPERSNKIRRPCDAAPIERKLIEPPPVHRKLVRWGRAIRRWIRAGCPRRTDDQVAALLAICQRCKFFAAGACAKCGCPTKRSRSALRNKLRMATEACPIGKWPADV